MKNLPNTALSFAVLAFCACSDNSNPAGSGPAASGRIEAGLVGTWVENPSRFSRPDTLVFSDTKFNTPFFSGVGTLFSAKDGLVKGGPDWATYGEYLRYGDTLYFDALLGEAANGVDKANASRYLKAGTFSSGGQVK